MPASGVTINLLDRDDFTHSPIGKVVTWATTYGRYIMVGTELIVLLAFISRFSLDRKLTDLKETIAQKQSIIEANIGFEQEVRNLQINIAAASSLMASQGAPVRALESVTSLMPPDVSLESFEYGKNIVRISATAGTVEGFSSFLQFLSASRAFTNVAIPGDIKKDPINGIEFQAELTLPK